MTFAWMLTYLAVSALLLVVAFGADAVLAYVRRPRRWAWAGAMLAMCVLPLALHTLSRVSDAEATRPSPTVERPTPERSVPLPDVQANTRLSPSPVRPRAIALPDARTRILIAPDSLLQRIDVLARLGWTLASVVCAALVFAAYRRMARVRRTWSRAPDDVSADVRSLAGPRVMVWYSDNIGPAAFGVRSPQIVVPTWVDALPASVRSLLLRHEASHLTAHDPLLLRVALGVVVLLPWNLPLLVAYRRLHRAVEHDCDARVLAATRDARGYGRLLLDMAERLAQLPRAEAWSRAARWLPAPIPGIGARRSELETRLKAMVPVASTWRARARVLLAGSAAVAGVLVACAVPSPESARSESARRARGAGAAEPVDRQPKGGETAGALSPIDSIMMFERLQGTMEKLVPRGMALIDSAVVAGARTAFPDLFEGEPTGDAFVWMLLDPGYRVVRTARGKSFYSMRLKQSDGSETRVPVGDTKSPVFLSVGTEEIMRAFPGLRREQIGMWSDEEVVSGHRTVRVVWARLVTDQAAQPVGEHRSDFPELPRPKPWERRDVPSSHARFSPWILSIASQYAPDLLAQSPNETPVLWLLLNINGDKLAHGSGRRGLYGSSQGQLATATTGFAPATAMTADKDLGISCSAFAEKFPDATRGTRAHSCGILRNHVGDRYVVVVYGITNPAR